LIDLLVLHLKTSKRLLLKYLKKSFDETVCGIGNDCKGAYAFLNLSSFLSFNW